MQAFQEKNQQAYVQVLREGNQAFKTIISDMTKMAGQKIELTAANYKKTVDTYMANPE